MKGLLKLTVCAGLAVAALCLTPPVEAQGFGITNSIAPATALVNYPTNSSGVITGTAVNADNYESLGVTFIGQGNTGGSTNIGTTGTTNKIVITFVRSTKGGPPTSVDDWETTTPYSITIPVNGTSRVYWITNMESWFVEPARWIGVSSITNTTSSATVTNAELNVTRKIRPLRYP
jgi:hypothetical protein